MSQSATIAVSLGTAVTTFAILPVYARIEKKHSGKKMLKYS